MWRMYTAQHTWLCTLGLALYLALLQVHLRWERRAVRHACVRGVGERDLWQFPIEKKYLLNIGDTENLGVLPYPDRFRLRGTGRLHRRHQRETP